MNAQDGLDVVVSGHLCVDLLPRMSHIAPNALTDAGRLYEVGPMDVSTGGAVSNTGLALHRLGVRVALMSGVGDDLLGQVILGFLNDRSPELSRHIRVRKGESSSYTIVLSPENIDRVFLHCTGTNQTFSSHDIDFNVLTKARIFHLGYPPLLPRLFEQDGEELVRIYHTAHDTGVITSLDLSLPDRQAPSGQANWKGILQRTLPLVDVFVPSLDEITFMLNGVAISEQGGLADLRRLANKLLDLSDAGIVGVKLSEKGVYLRAGSERAVRRLHERGIGLGIVAHTETYHPAFAVEVKGTTGAGDSAYAALLAALLRPLSLAECARWMCAVGAHNVEASDATSGIRSWEETDARMARGWPTLPGFGLDE